MEWTELKIVTTPEAYEAITALMYDIGAGGLYIEDPREILKNKNNPTDWDYFEDSIKDFAPERIIVKAYFPEQINFAEKLVLFKERLKHVKQYFNLNKEEIEITQIYEEDWANNWKQYYKPVRIGNNVVVKPTWEKCNQVIEKDIVIEMDPGMAFGTGTHETTRMCIALLEKYVFKGCSILDLGCGSGILGIAGIKLGANKCTSVDIDKNAVEVCKSNININNLSDKIEVLEGNLLEAVTGKYDIITANIIADTIIDLMSQIHPILNKNGIFISSGIIKDRYNDVKDAFKINNYKIIEDVFMGEWVAAVVSLD